MISVMPTNDQLFFRLTQQIKVHLDEDGEVKDGMPLCTARAECSKLPENATDDAEVWWHGDTEHTDDHRCSDGR